MSRPKRILAIDPGTHYMGVALLEGESLLYYGVKVIPSSYTALETKQEARKFITQLIKGFSPLIVAIERSHLLSRKPNKVSLIELTGMLIALAKRRSRLVRVYAPSQIKKHLTGDGLADKVNVAKAIVKLYPELRVYLHQNRLWKMHYHANMFDAIAIGITALHDPQK